MQINTELAAKILGVAFLAGAYYWRIRTLEKASIDLKAEMKEEDAEMKRQMAAAWRRHDVLTQREREHHLRILILLSILAGGDQVKLTKEVREMLLEAGKDTKPGEYQNGS